MSRTSRVPYHQNVYDLIGAIGWNWSAPALHRLDVWEAESGFTFPAAMREVYAGVILLGVDPTPGGSPPSTLDRFLAQTTVDDIVPTLSEVLTLHAQLFDVTPAAEPGPYLWIGAGHISEWLIYARPDGSDDPNVYADWESFLSPPRLSSNPEVNGWHEIGRFSDVVYRWFVNNSRIPYRPPWGKATRWHESPLLPFMLPEHQNGLWLRTPAEPFAPPVIDFLIEQLGEPERTPRPGNVTTYTWRPAGGTVRVTADEPGLTGGLSAWWLHAESPERLGELVRLVMPFGTLRETLRADTDAAREVLQRARGR